MNSTASSPAEPTMLLQGGKGRSCATKMVATSASMWSDIDTVCALRQFAQEELQRQQAKRDKVLEQLGSLQESSAKELWLKDLDHAEDVITQTLDL